MKHPVIRKADAQFHESDPKLVAAITLLESKDFVVYKRSCGRAVAVQPTPIHPLDLAEIYDERALYKTISMLVDDRGICLDYIKIDDVWYIQDVTAPRTRSKYA